MIFQKIDRFCKAQSVDFILKFSFINDIIILNKTQKELNMPELSDRTANFTDSVIRRMTRISNQYGAVNLSQGFPDFEPPQEILQRLAEVSKEDVHQYSITWGAQNFREALAKKITHFSGMNVDPNKELVVTCGSTEAMMERTKQSVSLKYDRFQKKILIRF